MVIFLKDIFYPYYTHLERGQTDLLILLFILLSYTSWQNGKSFIAGIFLAFASLLKIPAIFIYSIPIAIKDKDFIKSGLLTYIAITIISFILNGKELNKDYYFTYLPTIGLTGNLPTEVFNSSGVTKSEPKYKIDNVLYQNLLISHEVSGGTLLKFFNKKYLGVIGFVIVFGIIFYCLQRHNDSESITICWIYGMLSILLFHPMTHVMNYVWMLFIIPRTLQIIQYSNKEIIRAKRKILYSLIAIGSLFIGMGESISNTLPVMVDNVYSIIKVTTGHFTINKFLITLLYERVWIGGVIIFFVTTWMIFIKENYVFSNSKA